MGRAQRLHGPETAAGRPRAARRALLGVLPAVAFVLLACVVHFRPAARAARVLRAAGLGGLPASAGDVFVQRQGRSLAGGVSYVRFRASAEDIARLVERAGLVDPNEAAEPRPGGTAPSINCLVTWTGRPRNDNCEATKP